MTTATASLSLDRWYALAVVAGRERSIRDNILDRLDRAGLKTPGLELICPDEEVILNKGTPDRSVGRRLTLPGYILVRTRRLTGNTIVNIKRVNGVMEFLGGDERPQALSPSEVERILGTQKSAGTAKRRPSAPLWEKGQSVTVTNGPLSDFTGNIIAVNENQESVTLEVEIFGRKTPAQVPFRDLRSAS